MNLYRLFLLCLMHFLVDALASFLTPVMPSLEERLQVSGALIGIMAAAQILAASFSQPFWGTLSDRWGRGNLVLFGPLIALIMLSLVGLTFSYWMVLVLVIGSGLGVAMFHPEATAHAGAASARFRSAGVALFVISGHVGLGAGPMLSGWLTEAHGLEKSWWLLAPGLLLCGAAALGLHRSRPVTKRRPLPIHAAWGSHRRVMMPLLILSTLRAFVGTSLSFGMPFWWKDLGMNPQQIGLLSGLFLFSGGVTGFFCGLIVRDGREKPWIVWSFLVTLPALYWLSRQNAYGAMILGVILAGAALNATIPMVLVRAQREMPGGESAAASLILGVAWGLGGAIAPPLMRLAQPHLGHIATIQWLSIGLIGAIASSLILPRRPLAAPLDATAS